MPSCFICGRTRNNKTKLENITFHKFPKRPDLRSKWFRFVNENRLNVDNINKYSVICSCHFHPSMFESRNDFQFLRKNSVPSVIVARVKSAKNTFPEFLSFSSSQEIPDMRIESSTPQLKINRVLVKIPVIKSSPSQVVEDSTIFDLSVPNTSRNNCKTEYFSSTDQGIQDIYSSPNHQLNVKRNLFNKNIKSSFMIASNISECDTPRCIFLKRGIKQLSDEIVIKNKKLKELQRTLNRQKKEIGTLKTFILQLKKQRFLNDDASNILLDSSDVVLCMFVLENSIDVVPGERHNKCAWPKDQIVD